MIIIEENNYQSAVLLNLAEFILDYKVQKLEYKFSVQYDSI